MHRFISLLLCVYAATTAAPPVRQLVSPISDILQGKEVFYSTITGIEWTESDLTVIGTAGKKGSLSGAVIRDVYLHVANNESDPECCIEHTAEEDDAYVEFDEKFLNRPLGTVGARQVIDWERSGCKQHVKIINCERNLPLAMMLFDADVTLKRMIMGKKRIPMRNLPSFTGYSQKHAQDRMEEHDGFSSRRYETIFYLVPRKIAISRKLNSIEVRGVDFSVVPKDVYDGTMEGGNRFENQWAGDFSKQYASIAPKVKKLSILTEAYKLYALLRIAGRHGTVRQLNQEKRIPVATPVPDSIPAITFSEMVTVPAPLINKPARYQFLWIMISGGIVFRSPGVDGVIIAE